MDIIEQSCVLITSGSERLIALVQILHHRISSNYHKQAILCLTQGGVVVKEARKEQYFQFSVGNKLSKM